MLNKSLLMIIYLEGDSILLLAGFFSFYNLWTNKVLCTQIMLTQWFVPLD